MTFRKGSGKSGEQARQENITSALANEQGKKRGRHPLDPPAAHKADQEDGPVSEGGVINPGHSTDPKEARPRSNNPLAEHPKTTM